MPKILLFSDVHIATHKNSLRRLQHCLDALEWVFKTALDRKIKDVVFLGDLFQDREKIQVLPYQRTYEIINKYCDKELNLHLLIGNHDMWFADTTDVSSVYPLGSIDNVNIINKCCTINVQGLDIDFLPFTLNPLTALESFSGKSRILCGHLSLDGAKLNTFYKTQADVSVEYEGDMVKVSADKFKPYEKVFLGHYHGEQRIDHVEYVGSPLELNFAEAFQQKHIIELDTETLEQTYIVNTFSPRHLIINENDLEKYNLDNTFLKLIPKDSTSSDLAEMRNDLMEKHDILTLEFKSHDIVDDETTMSNIEDAHSIMTQDNEEMLSQYLKAIKIPAELEFQRLLRIGQTLSQLSQMN